MPGYYDSIDVSFGWNGDLQLSSGDIQDTSNDGLQSLKEQIHSICASEFGDWSIYPGRSAGLDDFVGEPNTRSTGNQIRDRISLALIGSEIVEEQNLEVKVIPVHIHRVLIIIKIHALPSIFNNLREGEVLQTSIVFDSLEQGIFFLEKTPQLLAD